VGQARPGEAGTDRWLNALTVSAILAAALFRLARLAVLPGEMYGDITIVYEYVQKIRLGHWPTYFDLSSGPLYHYLITPVVSITGLDFEGLKLASVVTSLGVLGATYAFVRELVDRELAIITVFIAGVSSWLLIFSRLGNSQIVTPMLSTGALYFAVRVARREQWWNAAACGAISIAGMYEYPQTFVLAPVLLMTLILLRTTRVGVTWRDVQVFSAAAFIGAVPFLAMLRSHPGTLLDGYITGKIQSGSGVWSTLTGNIWHALLAFHVDGDSGFRGNPAGLPHLDRLSGLLFLLGIVFWLRPERRRWAPVVLVPMVLLLVPSMLVLSNQAEVPSASRTLTAAPLAYLLVASGLRLVVGVVAGVAWLPRLATCLVLASIMFVNGNRYFVTYADGLPNHNVPFGRIIADYLQTLPAETNAFIVECCWGDAGQPEPKGIRYLDAGPVATSLTEIDRAELGCDELALLPRPAVLVWNPLDPVPMGLQDCSGELTPQLHTSDDGVQVFLSSEIGIS
jgi:4-amino-4-deoxy-L-arabinose transferase-like glycosyltransferase